MKLVLLLSTLFFSSSAYAQECRSLGWFQRYVMPNMPAGSSIAAVNLKEVPQFLQKFNRLPPLSQFEADEIQIITIPNDDDKVVMLYNKGCGVEFQRVSPIMFEQLMGIES